jgi:hypothetical protein
MLDGSFSMRCMYTNRVLSSPADGRHHAGGEIAGQEGGEHGPKAHGYW